jgi:hypothetical protein
MSADKYEIRINYKKDSNVIHIHKHSTIDKLLKLVEVYYDSISNTDYKLIYNDNIELNKHKMKLLSDLFCEDVANGGANSAKGKGDIIELYLREEEDGVNNIIFECCVCRDNNNMIIFDSTNLKLNRKMNNFQKLKFSILVAFPCLEMEYYTINYNDRDITDIYSDSKLLGDIFKEAVVKLFIIIKPKLIVEYHKRCHFCLSKADNICTRCALANCNLCAHKDPHNITKELNFVEIKNFKDYETKTLNELLKSFYIKNRENETLDSNNFSHAANEKINSLNKKFEDLIELINTLKNIQVNNLKIIIDSIKNKHQPEGIESFINDIAKQVKEYQKEPYVDCEESDRKLLSFQQEYKTFEKNFFDYKTNLDDMVKKYMHCLKLDNSLQQTIKTNINESRVLFKPKQEGLKFNRLMKIYDFKSVLVFDNNASVNKFSLMLFHDKNSLFKNNFSNYVQFNFGTKLFIITGTPCQKLFCYDIETNEMEYINTLKHSHNWWPVIYITKLSNLLPELNIFCLSGTYTTHCEELILKPYEANNLEWNELPSTNVAHGQATPFISDNNMFYLLYGYDYNFSSIGNVERLDLTKKASWENIRFKNPNGIEAILYYHANLAIGDNCYILGGLKTIEENDVVYNYKPIDDSLNKTEFNFNLCPKEVRFCNEKRFVCLNVTNDEDKKDLGKTLIIRKTKYNDCTFALFDVKNNIHVVNTDEKLNLGYSFIKNTLN